ncbi:MAG TPA: hypothetical protein VFQ01_09135 [Nocardioides sp.]|jgi:hypothetical protein|nr:hypothetical protein [Nocardioides sp.]
MTDCAVAAPSTARFVKVARRARRTRPAGVPRWAWLFGVAVVPLEQDDPDATQAWVVSAGAGTTHAVAVFHDSPYAGHRLQ